MRKRKHGDGDAFATPAGRPRMTPMDVQQKEFRLAFRGYNEREVDQFLDEVTEELAAHIEENRRLREEAGAGWARDASITPEQIVSEAREEAARIIREAEERAAVIAAGRTGDPRAIVAPYLAREREFLQSLGQLVQSHAESVRGMVQAYRQEGVSPESAASGSTAGVSEVAEPIRVPEASDDERATEESAGAPVAASDASEGASPGSDPQRSLRELFWGED